MATIINNPGDGGSNAGGWIIAIVVIVVLVLLALFVFPGVFSNKTNTVTPVQTGTGGADNGGVPVINTTNVTSTTTIVNPATTTTR